jgi:signal transduction histidine kinase
MKRKKEEKVSIRSSKANLEKLLIEKNIELEGFKRELQIEAALEKVRSRTMKMLRTDDLRGAVAELFQQLKGLGFGTHACAIVLYDKKDGSVTHWISGFSKKIYPRSYKHPFFNHPYFLDQLEAWEKSIPNKVFTFKGKLKKSYDELIFTLGDLKNFPEDAKKEISSLETIILSDAFMKYGMIEVFGNEPLPEENLNILKRFASVFEQTYTRFLDLQKAEAQALEARIEAALERIRTRTMSMRKSEELGEVAVLFYRELQSLGVTPFFNCGYVEVDEKNKAQQAWMTTPDGTYLGGMKLPLLGDPIFRSRYRSWKRKDPVYFQKVGGSKLKEHLKFAMSDSGSVQANEIVRTQFPDTVFFYCGNFSQGYLHIVTESKLNDEEESLLARFTGVFEMAYQRFLDLKKVEERAREAQIEAALERVRTRTMAMHRSEEIADIVGKIFEELGYLDIVLTRVLIWIFNKKEKYVEWWSANSELNNTAESYRLDFNQNPVFLTYLKAWEKKLPLFKYTLSGDSKISWEDYIFNNTGLAKMPVEVQNGMRGEGTIYTTSAISSYGLMMAGSREPLSDENTDIIQRFGRVFQQSYTRYLDVQKAETQAREAEIELGLERVRARAMAMQSSRELGEILGRIFKELKSLDVEVDRCFIWIIESEKEGVHCWIASPQSPEGSASFWFPFDDHPYFQAFMNVWREQKKLFKLDIQGELKKSWDKYLFETTEFSRLPVEAIESMQQPEKIRTTSIANKYGLLCTASLHLMSEENIDIFRRFGFVFEQSYTRFKDIHRAEAQAREAKIEAALERVRARTMAMHQSDELREVVFEFFEQLQPLGFAKWGFQLRIAREDEDGFNIWISTPAERILPEQYHIPILDHWVFRKYWNTYKRQIDQVTIEVKGDDKLKMDLLLFEKSDVKNFSEEVKKSILDYDYVQFSVASMRYGLLEAIDVEPIPQEEFEVLKRFAKVFEQTYTRFLDLNKAEAQAREAEIEIALERIRARALAMHSSEELEEVVNVLREQMGNLGQPGLQTSVIHIYPEDSETFESWYAFSHPGKVRGKIFTGTTHFRKDACALTKKWIKKYKSKENEYLIKARGTELKRWLDIRNRNVPQIKKIMKEYPALQFYQFADFSGGSLAMVSFKEPSNESKNLLRRAASVFDLAFRRFLDLKQAEEQAREAQIEVALERVRARSMGMHKSEELQEVIRLVFNQLQILGFDISSSMILKIDQNSNDANLWIATEEKSYTQEMHIPFFDHPIMARFIEARDNGEEFFTDIYNRKESVSFMSKMLQYPDFQSLPESRKKYLLSISGYARSTALYKYTGIAIANYNAKPFSEEENDLLKRFAKVFEQTYTRFLDLHKAEAQAREAQIEVALERVRARAMAMHKTDELREAGGVLYQELAKLGIVSLTSAYSLMDEDAKIVWYYYASPADGAIMSEPMGTPYTETQPMRSITASWEKQEPYHIVELDSRETIAHQTFIAERSTNFPYTAAELISFSPEELKLHTFNFKQGYLLQIGGEKLSPDQIDIMIRFTKVFEMTYRRFLDLQKAEAQAWEARIEAALEKVRARTMAMHKSDELQQVITAIFQQLKELGFDIMGSTIVLCDEQDTAEFWFSGFSKKIYPESYKIPYIDHPYFIDQLQTWKNGIPYKVFEYEGDLKKEYDDYIFHHTEFKNLPEEVKNGLISLEKAYISDAFMKYGRIEVTGIEPLAEEKVNILKRFAKVFEQTYTRFLDLKKAEAQAREAQIEAALERVRSRTMAMHKSEELRDAAVVLYEELKSLGITQFLNCGFVEVDEDKQRQYGWSTLEDGSLMEGYGLPLVGDPVLQDRYEGWKRKEQVFCQKVEGEDIKNHIDYVSPYLGSKEVEEMTRAQFPDPTYFYNGNFSHGYLSIIANAPLSEDQEKILARFTIAFEMTYKRFLDLKKAEAQAREAQIEAALERVRSKAMAMHNSNDLPATASVVFTELRKLGFEPMRSGISIQNKENRKILLYTATQTKDCHELSVVGSAILDNHPVLSQIYDNWLIGEDYFPELKGKLLKSYYEQLAPTFKLPKEQAEIEQYGYFISFTYGILYGWAIKPIEESQKRILKRFASVVDLTFKRYFDLQQAELNAREAQIEAALERVRSRTMAMHKSEELGEVIGELFNQMSPMGLARWGCALWLADESVPKFDVLFTSPVDPDLPVANEVPVVDRPVIKDIWSAYKNQLTHYNLELRDQKKSNFDKWFLEQTGMRILPQEVKQEIRSHNYVQFSFISMRCGLLGTIDIEPVENEKIEIVQRFAKVFDQTYTRFLDLQKAEAQAREAKIEAALERVRTKAMAMQKSEDLSESVAITLHELEGLDLTIQRCGIGIIDGKAKHAQLYSTTRSKDGKKAIVTGDLKLTEHPMLVGSVRAWEKQEMYYYMLEGKDLKNYYDVIARSNFTLPEDSLKAARALKQQYAYYLMFPAGSLYFFSDRILSEEEIHVLQRFTDVFHLAYTRYEDLQKAEARALEAIRQASLDRVRAEIASMRTADDLQRITPLIWAELTTLGVPFIRCGVFIVDNVKEQVQLYLSTPSGESLAVLQLKFNDTPLTKAAVKYWEKQKVYHEEWDQGQFISWTNSLIKRGLIESTKKYQASDQAPDSLVLHFIPFAQGMLYVGSMEHLAKEQISLVQSLADAFSVAYARYEDFKQLEDAKNRIENTLSELRSTQSQLIHAEKMASLGELTAGIAHEIQNPLNFVNNFSEVSIDLIEEFREVRQKKKKGRNAKFEKEILDDLIQNLEKINHHGGRASSIVKGMLEHSRAGNKEKELTDINFLADEFVRLAYHGLRAKDKSFKADFKLDLDEKLPKIKVLSQDIGRVLLNLINNAFYAVSEKAKKNITGYLPKVRIITKGLNSTIEIKVIDNANGIPKDTLEKIFQPFFTTKPAGEGTGLGLSISYDIITKGHNGKMHVETKEGEGSEFTIVLPLN